MNHFQPLGLRAQNCLRKTWKVCNFSLVWGERGSISDILNLSHCLHVMCLTFWGSNFWEECRAHEARSQADPYGHRRVHRAKPISLGPWPLSDISAIFAGLFVWFIPAPCLPPEIILTSSDREPFNHSCAILETCEILTKSEETIWRRSRTEKEVSNELSNFNLNKSESHSTM